MAVTTLDDLYAALASDFESWLSVADTFDKSQYEYLGVNLDDLVKSLMSKAGSIDTLRQDMMVIILVCQFRGANLDKVKGRMKAGGKARFEGLINKYGIVPHRRELPASTPSLPRILSLFPQIIHGVRRRYQAIVGRPLGTVPSGLDEALCFPGGCAMIKSTNTGLLDKWVDWYTSFCTFVKMSPMPGREQMVIAHRLSKIDESERQ
jgi:hypothetical protein